MRGDVCVGEMQGGQMQAARCMEMVQATWARACMEVAQATVRMDGMSVSAWWQRLSMVLAYLVVSSPANDEWASVKGAEQADEALVLRRGQDGGGHVERLVGEAEEGGRHLDGGRACGAADGDGEQRRRWPRARRRADRGRRER